MPNSLLSRFGNLFAGIASLLATVLLIAVIVYWGWYFFGPKPLHISPAVPENPAVVLRATSLFGATSGQVVEAEKLPVTLNGNIRLLGLIAQNDGQGYAVFRSDSEVFVGKAGDDIGGGMTLLRIEPNAMAIREGNGSERRIVLRDESAALISTASALESGNNAKTAETAAAKTSCVPADFKGIVVRLNTELLQGALTQPETFYALLEAGDNGLTVREDNGHAAMLGLRGGDQLHTANGIRLQQTEDISAAILRPLAAGQNVRLTGMRSGQEAELLLVNVSTCGG